MDNLSYKYVRSIVNFEVLVILENVKIVVGSYLSRYFTRNLVPYIITLMSHTHGRNLRDMLKKNKCKDILPFLKIALKCPIR